MFGFGAAILAWLLLSPARGAALPAGDDLAAAAADARSRRVPILLLFSQSGCAWCEKARREYLVPLAQDPASRRRVIVRQVELDSDAPLTDFAGRKTTHRRFAAEEKIAVTPTVVVFGPGGVRLAEPIVGFQSADFYGAYVERAIDEGLAKLR